MTLDLQHLEEVAKGATQGEWRWEGGDPPEETRGHEVGDLLAERSLVLFGSWHNDSTAGIEGSEADARYIATFDPPTTLALLARVRELERYERAAKDVPLSHAEQPMTEDEHLGHHFMAALFISRIEAVRALHREAEHPNSLTVCEQDGFTWPCPTIAALDGEGE